MLTAACLLSLPAPAFRRCAGWRLLHVRDVRRDIRPARTCTSASSAASPSGLKRPPVRHQEATRDGGPDVRSDTMADAPHDHSSSTPQQPAACGMQPGGAEPQKSYSSALCLIPQRSVWRQLQEIRCFKDKGFVRWPPHANLLYPFLEDSGSTFEAAAASAASALQDVKPFQVTLNSFKHFAHGSGGATLWLDPQSEELKRLQAALVRAFPSCTDLSADPERGIVGFAPHFSVGQWRSPAEAEAAATELAASWQPVSFTVAAVQLIGRANYHEPFRIRWEVPLGGQQKPTLVDVPYVATAGDTVVPPGGLASRYGIGADSINYFAFGANTSPKKLTGVRGIVPLESHAAKLPGWRLAFNHRGAMGNLVRVAEGEAAPSGMEAVHGVVHRLKPADMAKLTNMEHEYRPAEFMASLYTGGTVPCIAFVSPDHRLIEDGLPPSERYLDLLRTGAREWPLEERWCLWLESLASVHGKERDQRYYTSAIDGRHMAALPKIRVGSEQHRQGGRGGRGGRGRGRGRGGRAGGRGGGRGQKPQS